MKTENIGWQKYAIRILMLLFIDSYAGFTKALWGFTFAGHIEVNPIVSELTGLCMIVSLAGILVPLGFYFSVALLPEALMAFRKDDINLTEILLERYFE